ncbi:hypothetical protein DVK02_08170 [Halobellus sp. Atlit-31R]|nr:hypothetical protein DVK02_08170 [Halobellus sp. Atlit-31R]
MTVEDSFIITLRVGCRRWLHIIRDNLSQFWFGDPIMFQTFDCLILVCEFDFSIFSLDQRALI